MRLRLMPLLALFAATSLANEISFRTLQSGSPAGPTPLSDRGLHGQGQVIAMLDTGLDWDNCYFAEADNSPPPFNTGSQITGYQVHNIDPSRRKVIAYNFLWSCDQFPFPGCETPAGVTAFDNQGHGTHAAGAAAGDRGAYIVHDVGDAIAPAAKLIVQDAGFIGGDNCSQRPGLGCPVTAARMLAILDQAYVQGARIHSNSWGDRQGAAPTPGIAPPTANYPPSAQGVDEFAWTRPDMVIVFNTGNAGELLGSSSASAPGSAKNTIQVGGTRDYLFVHRDDVLASFSGRGPARDGRIKPDVVGPAEVFAAQGDLFATTRNCDARLEEGTSWAAPTIAGAVALIRQYYMEGFYPSGRAIASQAITPSAALLKATLIASARRVPFKWTGRLLEDTRPVPSFEQGFGFPVLDDALYFVGDRSRLRVFDTATAQGLVEGDSYVQTVSVAPGTRLKIVLVWTDPPAEAVPPNNTSSRLINDLDLLVTDSTGHVSHGNEILHPGSPDRLNNVEVVEFTSPEGSYQITVRANRIVVGPRQSFALVIAGDLNDQVVRRRPARR